MILTMTNAQLDQLAALADDTAEVNDTEDASDDPFQHEQSTVTEAASKALASLIEDWREYGGALYATGFLDDVAAVERALRHWRTHRRVLNVIAHGAMAAWAASG